MAFLTTRLRVGFAVVALNSSKAFSWVIVFGSVSLGVLTFLVPLVIYGPNRPLRTLIPSVNSAIWAVWSNAAAGRN